MQQRSGRPRRWLVGLIGMLGWVVVAGAEPDAQIFAATTTKPFELVVADAEYAIAEHNFRITGRNDLGGGIGSRTGKPFPQALIVHFCSLGYAQRLLEQDPAYIRVMPCRIFVYARDGQVTVETALLREDATAGGAIAAEINQILRAIVSYAAE